MKNGKLSFSYSFNQPYSNWPTLNVVSINRSMIEQMAVLKAVDNIVEKMLTYPDAEAILSKLKRR